MGRLLSSRWFHVAAVAVMALLVVVAYSGTFHAAFQFDDEPMIVKNAHIRSLSGIRYLIVDPRGISFATFALNYAAGGLDTFGWHIVNTAIHIINAALAYFLLYRTFTLIGWDELWSRRTAAFSALLFALHPVQTQAVTYIIQRMETLSSLFYLLALILFSASLSAGSFGKRLLLYAAVAASYALGFFSKESAITLPAVMLLYDVCFSGAGFKGVVRRLPLYAITAAMLVFFVVSTIKPLGGFGDLSEESAVNAPARTPARQIKNPAASTPDTISSEMAAEGIRPVKGGPSAGFRLSTITPREYLYTQFNVMTYYIALLAAPVNQNLDYDFPIATSLFKTPPANRGAVLNLPPMPPAVSLAILAAIAGAAVYMFAAYRGRRQARALVISFFIFWFFIILSPTSSFIPINDVIYEHRLYLPSLGFFTTAVIIIDMLAARAFNERGGYEKDNAIRT